MDEGGNNTSQQNVPKTNTRPARDPFGEMRAQAVQVIRMALESMGAQVNEVSLETPPQGMGEFAYACFPLAKQMRKNPATIAESLAEALQGRLQFSRNITTQGAYVNISITPAELAKQAIESVITLGKEYGSFSATGIRILLEHTSANPTGPLHIGRARNPIIADTIARAMRMAGHTVETEYYINDVGKQAAMLVWGVMNKKKGEFHLARSSDTQKDQTNTSKVSSYHSKADHEYVAYYQMANTEIETEGSAALSSIEETLRRMECGDPGTLSLAEQCINPVMDGITQTLGAINIKIDKFTRESSFIRSGAVSDVVQRLNSLNESREEDGARYLDMDAFGLHGEDNRFFYTRKDGTTLYTTRDIAYHTDKLTRCDIAVNVLGEDQRRAMDQLSIALRLIGGGASPDGRLKIIYYSFVSLPEGRMSTRAGKVVYLDDLLEEAVERAYNEVKKRRAAELSEERMRNIALMVGTAAVRYNIVRVQAEKQMVFRWEDALNFEGNSAPFIQYSHARACSILKKASQQGMWITPESANANTIASVAASCLSQTGEWELVKKIAMYPSIVSECAAQYRAHPLATYAHELADSFNQFYRDCPVLASEDATRRARLLLVECARQTLDNAMVSLGISAPDEM